MRWLPNLITLVRVPVIVMLASVSVDEPATALVLLGIGILSHAFDGIVAKWLAVRTGPFGFWHEMDTVYLSLGLQLAAGVWLVRADVLPWWVIPIYLVVALLLEAGYVSPHKEERRPFVPVVLYGSGVVWMTLTVLIAEQEELGFVSAVALLLFSILHEKLHPEVHEFWKEEAAGKRPLSYGDHI
jgi:phosphatidylglycerophosphate synthase